MAPAASQARINRPGTARQPVQLKLALVYCIACDVTSPTRTLLLRRNVWECVSQTFRRLTLNPDADPRWKTLWLIYNLEGNSKWPDSNFFSFASEDGGYIKCVIYNI